MSDLRDLRELRDLRDEKYRAVLNDLLITGDLGYLF